MGLGKLIGYGCLGGFYQCTKKTVKSDSIVSSFFLSSLAGMFGHGAYKLLKNDLPLDERERLEKELKIAPYTLKKQPLVQNDMEGVMPAQTSLPYSLQKRKDKNSEYEGKQ